MQESVLNLIIDIGNTRGKLVVFEGDTLVEQLYTDNHTLCDLDEFVGRHAFKKGIVSSVVRLSEEAERKLAALPFPVIRMTSETPLPMPLLWRRRGEKETIKIPSTMGADRIAALVGAMASKPNTPLLIVDAGTCVTYEVIDDEGYYVGGNIAPGLQMRLKSMHEHTALLPVVDKEGDTPEVGYSTETCMRSGAILGLQYEIEGYIHHWRAYYPELQVFLTGGDKMKFSQDVQSIIHTDNYLVPKGLNATLNALSIED